MMLFPLPSLLPLRSPITPPISFSQQVYNQGQMRNFTIKIFQKETQLFQRLSYTSYIFYCI